MYNGSHNSVSSGREEVGSTMVYVIIIIIIIIIIIMFIPEDVQIGQWKIIQ